jgi:hypothetical protein
MDCVQLYACVFDGWVWGKRRRGGSLSLFTFRALIEGALCTAGLIPGMPRSAQGSTTRSQLHRQPTLGQTCIDSPAGNTGRCRCALLLCMCREEYADLWAGQLTSSHGPDDQLGKDYLFNLQVHC